MRQAGAFSFAAVFDPPPLVFLSLGGSTPLFGIHSWLDWTRPVGFDCGAAKPVSYWGCPLGWFGHPGRYLLEF